MPRLYNSLPLPHGTSVSILMSKAKVLPLGGGENSLNVTEKPWRTGLTPILVRRTPYKIVSCCRRKANAERKKPRPSTNHFNRSATLSSRRVYVASVLNSIRRPHHDFDTVSAFPA